MTPDGGLILPPTELDLLTPAAQQERADIRRLEYLTAIEQEEREAEERFLNAPGPKQDVARSDVKHGICRGCSKRTQLWLPASICTKCLRKAAEQVGIDIDNLPKGDA